MSVRSTPVPQRQGKQTPDVVPYPCEAVEEYHRLGIWRPYTIAEEFHAIAEAHRDRIALVSADMQLSYRELDLVSDRLALGLSELGLRPSERVLLQLTNEAWTVIAWYGLLKAGLVPIATLPQHRRHELSEIARQAQPAAHLVQASFPSHDLVALGREVAVQQRSLRLLLTIGAERLCTETVPLEPLGQGSERSDTARAAVQRIQDQIDPDSLAVLQLSGGTTSIPKLIPRLHSEYWYNSRAYADAIGLNADACIAHALPVIHNAGIVCALHAAHSVGGCLALCAPDSKQLGTIAASGRLTHMLLVRPLARLILADSEVLKALGNLRTVMWSDRELPEEVKEMFETSTCRVMQQFGMGEGMCMVTPRSTPAAIRHHTIGAPISSLDEVRIYAPGTEDPVPHGERGELCCRGAYTIRGYFCAPERNAEAFTADGFYRTGDIVAAVIDNAGNLWYTLEDRIKDLISRGGEKINAGEVEGILMRHPAIAAAAVVGMPDERLGERACAFLVLTPGAEAPDTIVLGKFLEELGVAKFKWPERIEVRGALPLTNVQKVDKATLRTEIGEILRAEMA